MTNLPALLPDVSDKPSNAARASARSWVVSAPSDRESACSLSPSSRSCRLRKPSVTVWAYASAPLQDGTVFMQSTRKALSKPASRPTVTGSTGLPLSANLQAAVKAFRHGSLANASGVLMRSLIVGRQRESIRKQPTALYSAVAKSNF